MTNFKSVVGLYSLMRMFFICRW